MRWGDGKEVESEAQPATGSIPFCCGVDSGYNFSSMVYRFADGVDRLRHVVRHEKVLEMQKLRRGNRKGVGVWILCIMEYVNS